MSMESRHVSSPDAGSIAARLGLPLVLIVGAAMIAWTWGTWPDPLVDFGRELYVPWQLWQGRVLYRDVAHFNGPLSAYWNTLLYVIFGVSLRSLVIGNIAIAAAVVLMIWRLWRRAGGSGPRGAFDATIAGLLFVLLFATLQLVDIGNYNWITPYSHELTHGVALALAALTALSCYIARPRAIWAAACGFALGCALLTKVEVSVAAVPSAVFGLILAMRSRRVARPRVVRHWLVFIIAMIVPPVVAVALLAMAMPVAHAIGGTFASWRFAFDSRITGLAFYRHTMGTDELAANVAIALKQAAYYLLALGPAAAIGWWLRRRADRPPAPAITGARLDGDRSPARATVGGRLVSDLLPASATVGARLAGVAYGVGLVIVLALLRPLIPWQDAFRGLSVVAVAIASVALVVVSRSGFRPRPRVLLRTILSLFALLLLAKIFFAATLHNYGFALAMPAMLVASAAVTSWVPQWLERRRANGACIAEHPIHVTHAGALLRWAGVGALMVVVYVHLSAFKQMYRDDRPAVVARGTADEFTAQPRGFVVNELTSLLSVLPPGTTVAVAPQGVMVNYLSSRNNPTPYFTLMPPEVLMFGDETIRLAYEQNPPDVLVVTGSDLREYGYNTFADVAPQTAAWFKANYSPIRTIELKDLPPATILTRRSAERATLPAR